MSNGRAWRKRWPIFRRFRVPDLDVEMVLCCTWSIVWQDALMDAYIYIYVVCKLWPNFWRFATAYSDAEARTNGTYSLGFMITGHEGRKLCANICRFVIEDLYCSGMR